MELEFTKEDPKFAQNMAKERGGVTPRNVVLGVLGMFVGISIILGALIGNVAPVAIVGFSVMIASGLLMFTKGKISKSPKKQSNFMKKLEDKWERRREQENRS
ncbi:MAG: DUF3040 domain-containing protein [Enterococcus sp.]|nr:DUF3040 domain-containing protein [Enterococcus sp.]